jgi:hypothetical protein
VSDTTTDAPEAADAAEAADASETDDLRSGLLAAIEAELGEAVVGSHIKPGRALWVRVTAEAWAEADPGGGVQPAPVMETTSARS